MATEDELKDWVIILGRREGKPVAVAELDFTGGKSIIYASRDNEAKAPYDAVSYLIQSVMGYEKTTAGTMTAVTIYTNAPVSDMASGMLAMLSKTSGAIVAVDGSRAFNEKLNATYQTLNRTGKLFKAKDFANQRDLGSFLIPTLPVPDLDLTSVDFTAHTGYKSVHRIYMMGAFCLLNKHNAKAPDGKYVAALMANKQGRIIGWGINTNKANETYHAEVNMIQSYHKRLLDSRLAYSGLPDGARIYTTLQCCQMCSGMISSTAKGDIFVYYSMTDPAQDAKPRALKTATVTREGMLAATKGVKLHGAGQGGTDIDDAGALFESQFRNRQFGSMDAASFGRHMNVAAVGSELVRKYQRNVLTDTVQSFSTSAVNKAGLPKQVNPHVQEAVHHVCLFLSNLGINPGFQV